MYAEPDSGRHVNGLLSNLNQNWHVLPNVAKFINIKSNEKIRSAIP
jgi:hypothetical protein